VTVVDDEDRVAGVATLELLGGLLGNGALLDEKAHGLETEPAP
jgi:hypothetical protein